MTVQSAGLEVFGRSRWLMLAKGNDAGAVRKVPWVAPGTGCRTHSSPPERDEKARCPHGHGTQDGVATPRGLKDEESRSSAVSVPSRLPPLFVLRAVPASAPCDARRYRPGRSSAVRPPGPASRCGAGLPHPPGAGPAAEPPQIARLEWPPRCTYRLAIASASRWEHGPPPTVKPNQGDVPFRPGPRVRTEDRGPDSRGGGRGAPGGGSPCARGPP